MLQLMVFDHQVVKKYIQQSILEKELLYFGYEAFGITFVDPVSEQTICYHYIWPTWCSGLKRIWLLLFCVRFIKDTWTPEDVMPKKLREKQK